MVNAVQFNGHIIEEFKVKNGLRQGVSLTTLLFNILLEGLIRENDINRNRIIFTKSRQCLGYAGAVILVVRNKN